MDQRRRIDASLVLKWVSIAVVMTVTAALAIRQWQFCSQYAVNVLYWDQWDFYREIFAHRGLWDLFSLQHGPHRQGVGILITSLLARCSGCNTRWDAFSISATLIASSVLGLFLGICCGVRWFIALLAVPLLYLTDGQYESFAGPSNLSHGAMPLLLLTAVCLAWFIRENWLRISLISLLTFGLIFTGFGLFAGLLVPLLLLIEIVQALRGNRRDHATAAATGFLACAVTWVLFSLHYVFDSANPDFHFPFERPIEYFYFVAIMLSNFFGAAYHNPMAVPMGLLLTLGLLALCLFRLQRILRLGVLCDRASAVIFLLSAFSLLFCFNTAIGRVSFDYHRAALASRYVTLIIPAGMAVFLQLATLKNPFHATALALLYATMLMPSALTLNEDNWRTIRWLHDGKIAWRDTYLRDPDLSFDPAVTFQVIPNRRAIEPELQFIKIHRLNFYRDVSGPAS